MSSINLSWSAEGTIDSYKVYRSTSPMNVASLPEPLATGITTKSYSDATVTVGNTYYYRVASVKNGVEKVSSEINIKAENWNPSRILATPSIFLDDTSMTPSSWGSNTNSLYSFTEANAPNQPSKITAALNGLPVLRFGGSARLLANLANTKTFAKAKKFVYCFAVTKLNDATANYRRLFSVTGSMSNNGYARFSLLNGNISGKQYWAQLGSSNSVEYAVNATFASQNYEMLLLVADYNSGFLKLYRNGVVDNQTAIGTSLTTSTTDHTYNMSIGCLYNGSFLQYTNADIACMVSHDDTITSTEIDKLFGWAAHKYGLTANLPANHPYKTTPP